MNSVMAVSMFSILSEVSRSCCLRLQKRRLRGAKAYKATERPAMTSHSKQRHVNLSKTSTDLAHLAFD